MACNIKAPLLFAGCCRRRSCRSICAILRRFVSNLFSVTAKYKIYWSITGFIDPYLAGNRTAPTSASKTTGLCLGTRWTSRYQGEKFVAGRFAVAEGAQHGAGDGPRVLFFDAAHHQAEVTGLADDAHAIGLNHGLDCPRN